MAFKFPKGVRYHVLKLWQIPLTSTSSNWRPADDDQLNKTTPPTAHTAHGLATPPPAYPSPRARPARAAAAALLLRRPPPGGRAGRGREEARGRLPQRVCCVPR